MEEDQSKIRKKNVLDSMGHLAALKTSWERVLLEPTLPSVDETKPSPPLEPTLSPVDETIPSPPIQVHVFTLPISDRKNIFLVKHVLRMRSEFIAKRRRKSKSISETRDRITAF